MSALAVAILVSGIVEYSVSVKPVVSFNPPWQKIFRGESVTLTCNGDSTWQGYTWYKDSGYIETSDREITIQKASMSHSGNYQCKTSDGHSDAVRLDVSEDYVILQTPFIIFEGDDVTLRCHNWPGYEAQQIKFYKNGRIINSVTISEYYTEDVDSLFSGTYTCQKKINTIIHKTYSDTVTVSIKELFSYPKIEVTPRQITEGTDMIVLCDTTLNTLRESTELQFAFYKNKQIVQRFNSSNKYQVDSAQLTHAGKYTCEVKTSTKSVKKMSNEFVINISELFSYPAIKIRPDQIKEGAAMIILCDTTLNTLKASEKLELAFYKNNQTVQKFSSSNTYQVDSAQLEHAGTYTCEVKTSTESVKKMSKELIINILVSVSQPQLTFNFSKFVVGDNVDLVCESDRGSYPIRYIFYHMSNALKDITINEKGKAKMTLSNASMNMAGSYYCYAKNNVSGPIRSQEVILSVMEPVEGIRMSLESDLQEVTVGDALTLNCSVERGSSPNFQWLHNEEKVSDDSEMYQITEDGKKLYLHAIQLQHRGTYQCQASNQISPSRIFIVKSNIQTISVSDQRISPLVPSLAAFLLLLLLICAFLLFKYRQKIALTLTNCCPCQSQAGDTLSKSQNGATGYEDTRIQASSVSDGDQADYGNVPTRAHATEESVCYSSIDHNRVQKAAPALNTKHEDFSVIYTAVKNSAVKLDQQAPSDQDSLGSSACIYQNFNSR